MVDIITSIYISINQLSIHLSISYLSIYSEAIYLYIQKLSIYIFRSYLSISLFIYLSIYIITLFSPTIVDMIPSWSIILILLPSAMKTLPSNKKNHNFSFKKTIIYSNIIRSVFF